MRICGLEINNKKRVVIGLTYIYGIGLTISKKIEKKFNIEINTKIGDLNQELTTEMEKYIDENYKIRDELKRELAMHYKKLINLKCHQGFRRMKNLPVHGRTHSNGKTAKKLLSKSR